MSVDGVYLRIFNNNPGWTLKRPKEFTIALLETWAGLASQAAPPVRKKEERKRKEKERSRIEKKEDK